MRAIAICFGVMLMVAAGCDGGGGDASAEADASSPAGAPASAADETRAAATQQASRLPRVVFLGDSITAGYGVEADQAFPAVVDRALDEQGIAIHAVNAGVSGDTTAGGLRRLEWVLRQKPDVVVVGLGGNDGLRGLELKASEENLRGIIRKSRDAGARVLLLGMMIPPNYGPDYAREFREIYPRLAKEQDVELVPFVLEGVGGEARLNQRDGIHPTAEGHAIVARNVVPHLRKLIRP